MMPKVIISYKSESREMKMETTTRNKHIIAFQESSAHQQDFNSSLSAGVRTTPDRIMQVGFSSSRKRKKPAADAIQVRGGGGGGRKDKHSKVCTARGATRDRRLRLSPKTAIQFYDVQDRLGYDRPSKAVDWLMNEAKSAIDALLLLHPPPPPPPVLPLPPHHDIYNNPAVFSFDCFPPLSSCYSEFQVLPIVVGDETPQVDSVLEHTYHHHHAEAFYTWNHNNNNSRSQFSAQREPLQSIHNYPIITPNYYSPPFPGIIINNHSSVSNSNQELLHMPNSFLHFQE